MIAFVDLLKDFQDFGARTRKALCARAAYTAPHLGRHVRVFCNGALVIFVRVLTIGTLVLGPFCIYRLVPCRGI